jgi:DNA topoisomerase-2
MKKEKTIEEKYRVLDQISHVLLRPQTYVGSNKPNTSFKWVLDGDKIVKKEITYVPSFLKIFDEIITNSIDESKRNPKLNRIDVNIKDDRISVRDNGGIKVVIHKDHNLYLPEVLFGVLLSGSNYNDDESRIGAGTNGYGGKLTNVFSKQFIISTCDGKKHFTQTFTNNMRERDEPVIKNSKINFTQISYLPDYEKFGLNGIDDDHFLLIKKRVIDIAGCNSNLSIYFNGEIIDIKSFEDYMNLYKASSIYQTNKENTWSFGITSSEEGFQQVSFANSTDTYDGGTHLDYITNQILSKIREFIKKKWKTDVKPSEIKNHIFIFLNSTIINPAFSSQTKEKLITEVKDFGFDFEISDKTMNLILKSDIISSISDWLEKKKVADDNKLTRQLNKQISNVKVDKLIDAKGKDRWKCSIGIYEGDSAAGSFRKYRDSTTMGAFALKGKFINVSDISNVKLASNKEAVDLMSAIGLKLGGGINLKDLRYGRILIYTDADTDGNHIASLLINFFYAYWPELFERNMIYKVETPIVVAEERKNKKNKKMFYSQTEYDNWVNKINTQNWEIKYKKGLAALVDDEYNEIINNPKLLSITKDDLSRESLNIWFGKDSDLRKKELI